jgi:hypothetical protein
MRHPPTAPSPGDQKSQPSRERVEIEARTGKHNPTNVDAAGWSMTALCLHGEILHDSRQFDTRRCLLNLVVAAFATPSPK